MFYSIEFQGNIALNFLCIFLCYSMHIFVVQKCVSVAREYAFMEFFVLKVLLDIFLSSNKWKPETCKHQHINTYRRCASSGSTVVIKYFRSLTWVAQQCKTKINKSVHVFTWCSWLHLLELCIAHRQGASSAGAGKYQSTLVWKLDGDAGMTPCLNIKLNISVFSYCPY